MKIGYFGTPEHSKLLLEKLFHSSHEILFVVTNPDKPKGRKKEPVPSPVKEFAVKHSIPVFQPERLRGSRESMDIQNFSVDLNIVFAYGQIIPDEVFNSPPMGSINLHGSILPKYRGASPVQTAIWEGEKETGYSLQYVATRVDSGNILATESFPILDDDTTKTIMDKITELGGERILSLLKDTPWGEGTPQNHEEASYCKKILSEDRQLNFANSHIQIHNKVRALNPHPLSTTQFRGKRVILIKTDLGKTREAPHTGKSGELVKVYKKSLFVICGDKKMLSIEELQLEGKKPMRAVDFLNGFSLKEGESFL